MKVSKGYNFKELLYIYAYTMPTFHYREKKMTPGNALIAGKARC